MAAQLEPPRRPRPRLDPQHAAMRDVGGYDDPRHAARAGRGVKSSDRSGSPPRGPRHSPHREARHRPSPRPEPSHHPHSRHASPNRDRERRDSRWSSPEGTSRQLSKADDLIPRFREKQARGEEAEDKAPRRSRSRNRVAPGSPYSSKRHRSRSRSPGSRHRKKSKRQSSPSSRPRGDDHDSGSKRRRRHSPRGHRRTSPRPYASPSRDTEEWLQRRRQTGSASPRDTESRRRGPEPAYAASDNSGAARIPSPGPPDSRTSSSRPPRPSRPSSIASSQRDLSRQDLEPQRDYPTEPPRSPRGHRDRRRRLSFEPYPPQRVDIEEEMGPRGGYRGGYDPMYSHKSQYHHDPRAYSQSPRHGPSYHNSPTHSPYGGSWSGRGGQYPSPSHYPPSRHPDSGSYGQPDGPGGHYHSGPPRSPSYNPHPNSYRGGPRGGDSRGPAFNGRGGQRGSNFKPSPWVPGGGRGRGHAPDEPSGGRQPFGDSEPGSGAGESKRDSLVPPRDPPVDDSNETQEKSDNIPRGPSGRAPPSGPSGQGNSSAKFSFAFKPSSKPGPTAPKPEISSKFNAAPQRRVSLEKPQNDRAPPPSAPTEPASARARQDPRNPPDGPRFAPRMRKVKKIMKRPKARPTLPTELVASESVFFRKPGNESVVGSGTYGKVFKGLNVYTKGLVALKRIRMEGERDGFPVTAVREIKLLQSLRHTNIVNLQEVMVEKNDCFMVFEYLSHDLTGLLNHPSFKLEQPQMKDLARQLFEGLDYLHTRGVLHRDIKAANILVSNEGVLKLADFGLARFYAKHHRLDYTNRVITIWYRSPELLLGETQYTAAVDVWSAACVMVEIFTRHAIFPGDGTELSQLEKIYNIFGTPNLKDWPGLVDMAWFELLKPTAKKRNVFADKYKERLTPAAFELLSAMLQYDPSKRPSAAEVLQHAYFTTEEPPAKQATELSTIGDWHEFESKALRKENERKDREARKANKDAAASAAREKDKKRPIDSQDQARDAKRVHVDEKSTEDKNPQKEAEGE